jgi:hypothetical protein
MAAGPVPEASTGRRPALAQAVRRIRDLLVATVRRHALTSTVAAASVVLGLAVGAVSFVLQTHFTTVYQSGHRLSGWQNFLRLGAPWQALVPVALAGLLATWGALRLGSAPPEPPLGLSTMDNSTASELRGALRSERRTVRVAFVVMTGLVGIVVARFLVYGALTLNGNRLAHSTLVGVAVELAIWLAAWVAFWNWNRCHRNRMEGWGVFEA